MCDYGKTNNVSRVVFDADFHFNNRFIIKLIMANIYHHNLLNTKHQLR